MFDTPDSLARTIAMVSPNLTDRKVLLRGMSTPRSRTGRLSDALVWVTDLLNPKRAYFLERFPELAGEVPFERRELMWAGSDLHEEFGRAVAPRMYREQYVGMEGIIGRIDIFRDHPVEVKRTRDVSPSSDILVERPENVEQLAMYCAMTRMHRGTLVYYIYRGEDPGAVLAFDMRIDDPGAVLAEMRERRDLLLRAWQAGEPSLLPGCPWYGKGCECERECDCASSRPLDRSIVRRVSEWGYDPEGSERLTRTLNVYLSSPRTRVSYWGLILPRKYWFRRNERADPPAEDQADDPSTGERLAWLSMKRGIERQIRHCPGLQCAREFVEFDGERVPIETFRNVPTVIVLPRFASPVPPDPWDVARLLRNDLLKLGMQCALAGRDTGRLILYYQNTENDEDRLSVYMVHFRDTTPYLDFMQERMNLIRRALDADDLSLLPLCPRTKCSYREYRCRWYDRCRV